MNIEMESVARPRCLCQTLSHWRKAIRPAYSKGLVSIFGVGLLPIKKQKCFFQPSGMFFSNVTQGGKKRHI